MIQDRDLLLYAGGAAFQKYGTFTRRVTTIDRLGEDLVETCTRAGVATGVSRAGYVHSVAANTPRVVWLDLDGDGVRETCSVLVEDARTNTILQSEDASTTWTTTNVTVNTNAVKAPSGATTADQIVEDASASVRHRIRQALTITGGETCLAVCWFRYVDRPWVYLELNDGAGSPVDAARVFFNVQTGVVGSTDFEGAGSVNAQGIEEWVIDGVTWYRVWASMIVNPADTSVAMCCGLADADLSWEYAGDGASSVYWWGAQLERVGSDTAARPSSYIPTTTSTVTRSVDQLSVPWPWSAGTPVQVYAKFRELQAPNWDTTYSRIWQVGGGENVSNFSLYRRVGQDDYQARHKPTTAVFSTVSTLAPSYADTIETLTRLTAAGTVTLEAAKNDGASIVGATSAALDAVAYANQTLAIGAAYGTNSVGMMALVALIVARPSHTLADFRALLP